MPKKSSSDLILYGIFMTLFSNSIETPVKIEINTRAGRIIGLKEKIQSKDINSFLGVPYAEPPINDKRFSPPKLKESWSGVLNATKKPNSCPQMVDETFGDFAGSQMWNPNTNMNEDCLYMNIWMPASSRNGKLHAVMIWIYGGGFYSGSATLDLYDGRILAALGNVVVINFQYRLGTLGFLYLDHPSAPGNMGLLDQSAAITWIYNNIESFGGDKNRITLFGESAGAASVALQSMSPLSQRYINNIILQSASPLAKWAVDSPETAKSKALQLAKFVNCNDSDIEKIINCLKQKDVQELTNKMWKLEDTSYVSTPVAPTIDQNFLKDLPEDIIKSGDFKYTDALVGFNKNEGTYFLIYEGYVSKENNRNVSESKFKKYVGEILNIEDSDLKDIVAFEYGVPDEFSPNYTYVNALDNLIGDLCFICPLVDLAEKYIKAGRNIYMYNFHHRTSANPWPEWTGVMHGYEIDHVFGAPLNKTMSYSDEEKRLSERMIKYWTNFAKSGNPNRSDNNTEDSSSNLPEWPVYTGKDKTSLVLDTQEQQSIVNGPKHKECTFWRDLYPNLKTKSTVEVNAANCRKPWHWIMASLLHPIITIMLSLAL